MVVHSHGLSAAVSGCLAARLTAIPSLFTAHNIAPTGGITNGVVRPILRSAQTVIAVTGAVQQSLIGMGIDSHKIEVISNGVEHVPGPTASQGELRRRYGLPPDVPVVLALGRLSHEKGFDVLVRSAAIIRNEIKNVVVAIAGVGPESQKLDVLCNALNLSGTVVFLGQVSNPRELMHCATVTAIPSRTEGQSLVAMEAMDAGCVIVASNTGGLIETLQGGEAGCLVEPENEAALANAIVRLINQDATRRAYIEAGRIHVHRNFSAQQMYDKTMDVYEKLFRQMREV
jgi:glycosyltransferase involved in cell wall biosynthesis